jgi:hypothetical protein
MTPWTIRPALSALLACCALALPTGGQQPAPPTPVSPPPPEPVKREAAVDIGEVARQPRPPQAGTVDPNAPLPVGTALKSAVDTGDAEGLEVAVAAVNLSENRTDGAEWRNEFRSVKLVVKPDGTRIPKRNVTVDPQWSSELKAALTLGVAGDTGSVARYTALRTGAGATIELKTGDGTLIRVERLSRVSLGAITLAAPLEGEEWVGGQRCVLVDISHGRVTVTPSRSSGALPVVVLERGEARLVSMRETFGTLALALAHAMPADDPHARLD